MHRNVPVPAPMQYRYSTGQYNTQKPLREHIRITMKNINTKLQCCGSGAGSAWIRNFLSDPDPDPELEVSEPDPGQSPKLDLKMRKNHKKMN
jgi:hypothetical protein